MAPLENYRLVSGRRISAYWSSSRCLGCHYATSPTTLSTVCLSEQAQHYAGAEGFITDVYVESVSYVEAGTPIIKMSSTSLEAKIQKLTVNHREQSIQASVEFVDSGGRLNSTEQELRLIESELEMHKQKLDALLVRCKLSGTFILPETGKTKGRFLR